MAQLSAFDVLGPNMIGPSSSHTAGAAVIAYLAQMTNVSGILSESHPNAALNIILYQMTPSPIFTQTLWIS